jgi:hypothetical protein
VLLTDSDPSDNAFTVTGVDASTATLRVRAVDTSGNESAMSAAITVSVTPSGGGSRDPYVDF